MTNYKELPDELKMVVTQARKNLVDYQIATNKNYIPNWHHDIIGKELENIALNGDRDYKILIVTVPPRHGKSQQVSIDFGSWLLGKYPTKEIITSSYSADLAQDFGGKAREKYNSPIHKLIFPESVVKDDANARGHWQTDKGGGYTSVGVGGPITGRGADVFLIDDPVKNREEAESETMRKKIWDWFTSTAFTRLAPGGVVVIIMTRWHLEDLAGLVLDNPELKRRTKVIRFEAIAECDHYPYRGVGEALWPSRYPHKALTEIKNTVGPYDWSALYQGNPVLTENQEFLPSWIRRTEEAKVAMMNCRRFLTIDTAMSKKAQADSTGFCDNRVNNENFWHLRAWAMKLSPKELVDAIFHLHTANNYEAIGIEKTTYTEGLKPYLEEEQRKRGIFLPIVELSHNQTQKEVRIRGLIPRYASGSVFHVDNMCKDLEEQMAVFPVGIHDDVVDAVAYQLQVATAVSISQVKVVYHDY